MPSDDKTTTTQQIEALYLRLTSLQMKREDLECEIDEIEKAMRHVRRQLHDLGEEDA